MGANKLLLLVDDDPDFLAIQRPFLEANGYRVECSLNPQDAVDTMKEQRPDLVITDLMMNSLNSGFSLSKQITQDPLLDNVPVIIVTAIGACHALDFRPQVAEDLKAMHADAYFAKPVAPDALLAKVRELLDNNVERKGTHEY